MSEVEKRIFDYSLRLLARRAYSVAEMRRKLIEKGQADENTVNTVLEKLVGKGLLDDKKFAEDFVDSKLRRKPVGRKFLSKSLQEKQVDQEIIRNVLEKIDEVEVIKQAIRKRLRVKGRPKTLKEWKSFRDYLIRQGFDCELVHETIQKLFKSFDGFE